MHNHMVPHHARVVHRETAVRSIASVNEATNVNEAVQQRRAARKRFQAHYRALYDELLEILFQLDPIGVHRTNTEKFVPELATILPRLRDARSPRTSNRSSNRSSDGGTAVAAWPTRIRSD